MLTRTHPWSPTQKALLIAVTAVTIGAFVSFANRYQRSHRLPNERILFGTWQMTAPHDEYVLGLHDIVGAAGGKPQGRQKNRQNTHVPLFCC